MPTDWYAFICYISDEAVSDPCLKDVIRDRLVRQARRAGVALRMETFEMAVDYDDYMRPMLMYRARLSG